MSHARGLSSQLFLILHDPFTGVAHVGQELLEYGVVAAELADLVVDNRLHVDPDDHLIPGPAAMGTIPDTTAQTPGDYVLQQVVHQGQSYPARTWVGSDLGAAVTDLVAADLVAADVVRHERVRVGLRGRKQDRFPSVDLLGAAGPQVRMRGMLRTGEGLDLRSATVVLLVDALGAVHLLDADNPQPLLGEVRRYLPPELSSLVAGLTTVVAAASVALSGRRR